MPAAGLDLEIEDITKRFNQVSVDDETQITVCSWNINGKAKVELRKMVTTATFLHPHTNILETDPG